MGIVDFWNNPLAVSNLTLVGYRGSAPDFSHDLYSYLLSSIRDADQKETALVWRFLQPLQQAWEAMYATFFSAIELLSPENCPAEYLNYLRKQIGILDDLAYLWNELTESERRRLIQNFVRFLKFRSTDTGFLEMLETMTGRSVVLHDYFFFRWIVSGDSSAEMETAIGREDEGYDSWAISEGNVLTGTYPDSVSLVTYGTDYAYKFVINTLVARNPNPPVGEFVVVRYIAKGSWTKGVVKYDGTDYFLELTPGYYFGQPVTVLPLSTYMFYVGCEPDPYVSDILIEDTALISHTAIRALVKFSRPLSSRIYIRYYSILESFDSLDRWDLVSGLALLYENEVTLADTGVTLFVCNIDGSDAWTNYCAGWRLRANNDSTWFDLVFMRQSSLDYYYVRLTPSLPPTIPAGAWELRRVVGGFDTLLYSGNLDYLDTDVDYYWRVECFTSPWPGGDAQIIRLYQDEMEIFDHFDNPAPWGGGVGTVGVRVAALNQVVLSKVYVHPLPMESDLVAPN